MSAKQQPANPYLDASNMNTTHQHHLTQDQPQAPAYTDSHAIPPPTPPSTSN
jgi:hypothetical protein